VKIFRSEDEEMFIHAEREFMIMQRLKGQPNIVLGVEYIPEFLRSRGYLVMEKVFGEQIICYVYKNGPCNESKSKVIIR
jgi:serine/threonine protein kinase